MSTQEKIDFLLERMRRLDNQKLDRWQQREAIAECAGMWWGICALLDLSPFAGLVLR